MWGCDERGSHSDYVGRACTGLSTVERFWIAARTPGGSGRQPHIRACSSCQRTRCSIVAFLGMLFLECQSLFMYLNTGSRRCFR